MTSLASLLRPHTPCYIGDRGPEHHTPTKSEIQGACHFARWQERRYGIPFYYNDIFRAFAVRKNQGYSILRDCPRRFTHNPYVDETRGRPRKLSDEDINKIEKLLWEGGFDARALPWEALPAEAGVDVDVCGRTVRRALHQKDWRKCVACGKGWVSEERMEQRKAFCREALAARPERENWRNVLFTDEFHIAIGYDRKVQIIRKPGERECPECIQERLSPIEGEERRREAAHFWSGVGYDHKLPLVPYDVPTNNYGTMTQDVYMDILEKHAVPLLSEWPGYVLEEDNAPGHGPGETSRMHAWKRDHGLTWYFNCSASPDFSPIENCWKWPKQHAASRTAWEKDSLIALADEGWENLKQKKINQLIDSIPARLHQCIDEMDGKMTTIEYDDD